MSERLYTQREVSGIFLDVPNKTLIYWARQGLVEWAAETKDARGIARFYRYWNLFQMGLVRELAGLGFSIGIIRDIMESMFKDYPKDKRLAVNDDGETVEAGLPSEFFFSGSMPPYFVIVKGATTRGIEDCKIEIMGFSNFTKDDLFKLKILSNKKKKLIADKSGKSVDIAENITTYIIIDLSKIKQHLDFSIEDADLD